MCRGFLVENEYFLPTNEYLFCQNLSIVIELNSQTPFVICINIVHIVYECLSEWGFLKLF